MRFANGRKVTSRQPTIPSFRYQAVRPPDAILEGERFLQMSSRRMIICITFLERIGKDSVLLRIA
jgi:hypothetical protein